ncbi:MAG: NAD(FAD)-utilizing dehydrogenase [Candidatus Campbellbacteria bacterium GW2011_OD1_34_28]|nr:MAG: NAD(FAD)-utilizing dehydrogenase [Candidatus Campbellbacteria bacterium GW2011_OD1_34_28]
MILMKKLQDNPKYDLIVIGGGPSGMMMAGRACELGARVLILEKNKHLGKKLQITGGGRCNITNAEFDVRKFLSNFPESKEFLFSPFSKFSAKDTFTFFEKKKLPLVIEARKRAFPQSQKADDVFKVLEKYIKKGEGEIKTDVQVVKMSKEGDKIISVETKSGEKYFAKNFAIATGGASASWTGSTGDGFRWLKKLGHAIKEPNANLVPLTTNDKWIHRISGLTLSFMTIRFIQNNKTKLKKTGKILFTHFGISGPLILNSAYEVKKLLEKGPVTASIDMFPDTEENDLDKRVLKLFEKNKNKVLKNIFPELVQKNLAIEILNLPDINLSEREANSITKLERKNLVRKLKNLSFEITGTLGLDKAIISDGGIVLEEVNFKNMSSKIYSNLYLLGDVLNINRPSGGFSLQLCWTTGWTAGTDVGEKVAQKKKN